MHSQRIFRLCVRMSENGTVSPRKKKSRFRLHNLSSVYAEEVYAIYRAPLFISPQTRIYNFLMCSDLFRAIAYLYQCLNTVTAQIFCQLSQVYEKGCCVVFCWAPYRASFPGNEVADIMPKNQLQTKSTPVAGPWLPTYLLTYLLTELSPS
jgi:hypothetical protein